MTDAIAAATVSMLTDLERLRAVGENFANSGTPAYKGQHVVGIEPERFAGVLATGDASSLVALATDPRAGALRGTGRSLDLAIEGAGFFEVQTADGARFTRRGDFRMAADGTLETADGYPVVTDQGVLRLSAETVAIDESGTVRNADRILGRLTVSLLDEAGLVHEGNGLYRAAGDIKATTPGAVRVRQGYLEAANVQPVAEMVRMMETVRHFGLTAQALRAHDQMLETGIARLGEF